MATENKPIVGKEILRSLILNLYDDSRTIFREYVQNACDAVFDAISQGLISPTEGLVAIKINPHYRNIEIRDNGSGISANKAISTLMDISNSMRDGITYAGQYGIGRLVGGGYCDNLIFTTSSAGETIETTLSIDIIKLREILDDTTDHRDAVSVMQDICTATTKMVDADSHYFIVSMVNVRNGADVLLDEEEVIEYIKDVAPIDYTTQFKQLLKHHPEEYDSLIKNLRRISVTVNDTVDIRKRYGLSIAGNEDPIKHLRFFTLSDAAYKSLAWGWYAVTPFTKAIPPSDRNGGFRLRKHNISLDYNILNDYFKEDRGNKYFYGEIFICHNKIEPNSARNGLVVSPESQALFVAIRKYFAELTKVYTKANAIKNAYSKMEMAFEDISKRSADPSTMALAVDNFHNLQKAFFEQQEKDDIEEKVREVLDIYKESYEENLKGRVDALEASLVPTPPATNETSSSDNNVKNKVTNDKPQNDIHEPYLQPEVKTPQSPIPPTAHETSNSTEPPHISSTITGSMPSPQSSASSGITLADVRARMEKRGLSEESIQSVCKVFGSLIVYCPPANKAMLNELIKKALENLLK